MDNHFVSSSFQKTKNIKWLQHVTKIGVNERRIVHSVDSINRLESLPITLNSIFQL